MDIANRFKAFFLSIISQIFQFLPNSDPQQPPLPPPFAHDLERAAKHNPQPARPVVAGHHYLDWAKIIVAFCFASVVDIAILFVQNKSQLPPTFHLLSLAMSFAVASLFVAKFIGVKHPVTAHVLDHMGVIFAATAFFLAVTIPFPLSLKCVTWTLYAVALLTVLICNFI